MSRSERRLLMLAVAAALLLGGAVWLLLTAIQGPGTGTDPEHPEVAQAAPPPAASPPPSPGPAPTAVPAGPPPEVVAARLTIEKKIAGAPDIARFFDRLRLTLPSDYESAISALARRRGAVDESPDVYLSEAVKTLRQSRGALAAKADGPALARVFAQQLALLTALSVRDPRLCVDFLYGGASEGFFLFSADNRALVSDLAVAGLDAILDGKQKNIPRGAPNEADFQVFEAALKKNGLAPPEIDALLDGKTPDPPLPDERMCAAGKTYLQTLSTLPEASRLRIQALAVDLMARS
jgi:hypothetical protein